MALQIKLHPEKEKYERFIMYSFVYWDFPTDVCFITMHTHHASFLFVSCIMEQNSALRNCLTKHTLPFVLFFLFFTPVTFAVLTHYIHTIRL